MSRFILMLTRNDHTVPNALEVYEELHDISLSHVGFKDVGVSVDTLKRLADRIHADGRRALLEVVSTSAFDELASVHAAIEIGVDYVMGGRCASEAAALLNGTGIEYFPFCGRTAGIPTRLEGSIDEIVADARRLAEISGVSGLDLLSYRFSGDAEQLTRCVVRAVDLPVVAAGSIDCEGRIRAVCEAGVWGFTIGSALFEGRFARKLVNSQARSIVEIPGVES